MYYCGVLLFAASLAPNVLGYGIPSNLQAFYNNHKTGKCNKAFAKGFTDGKGVSGFGYCGDAAGTIYLYGNGAGGKYADMDIDCDGANNKAGKCKNDPSGQGITAFQDTVKNYGIKDLDANIHPYVVFGNEGASPKFDPQSSSGMKPLSVMAIVCGGQMHYGIWGDTNGGTSTGEASIALADLCFPNEGLNADKGHDSHDVLYIGFTDSSAAPGKSGAKWTAKNAADFEASIKSLGDRLVAKL
ncbi:MAG: hypothetical protein M1836_000702 [Candelina mexicana]|nr:MAG: hypothetical protein M1836_000702 [Candelina mexicana]